MRALLLWVGMFAAPVAAQVSAPTVQQRFDAARVKLEANDAAGALAELQALEDFVKAQPRINETNLALTRVQKAEALIRLDRHGEAKPLLQTALGGPGLSKPALATVRDNARLMLAQLYEAELDHAAAASEFLRLAGQSVEPVTRTVALMGAARTEMFTDAEAALRHIDEALAIAEKDVNASKRELANVLGLKGRILINGGRYAEARTALVRAVALRGGLTQKVFYHDVALRADAAIAMLNLGQEEAARKYLAYTGAGRTEVQLDPPVEMPLPPCGGLDDLRPEDSAVIEFSILDDGRVVSPRPIYASRQGESAYAFARAVSLWSWKPENASKVKPFFRLATRVELRCSNKATRPPIAAPYDEALAAWASDKGVAPLAPGSEAARALEIKRRLDALPAGDGAERLFLIAMLARNNVIEREQRATRAAEAVALGRRLDVPRDVLFGLALNQAGAAAVDANLRDYNGMLARRLDAFRQLLAVPEFSDPKMRATVHFQIAQDAAELRREAEQIAALNAITDMPGLTERDPLKVAAWVQLANVFAARKMPERAAAAYARTGLSAQQCALIDGGPVMLKTGASSSDFPGEAMSWGFEGWTVSEFDVAADGSTRNQRIVAAFPPRIFAKASEGIARDARFSVSYRPEGDLACTSMQRKIRYTLGF